MKHIKNLIFIFMTMILMVSCGESALEKHQKLISQ